MLSALATAMQFKPTADDLITITTWMEKRINDHLQMEQDEQRR